MASADEPPWPPNLRALQRAAQRKLSAATFGYYAGGADDEETLRENEAAWRRWRLRPRVLVDVSAVCTRTTLQLGGGRQLQLASPLLAAPMAMQRLAHADGELGLARAAAGGGWGYCLSTLSTTALEEVAAGVPPGGDGARPVQLFQLYVMRDRGIAAELVRRAEAAGFAAIVLTVDAPFLGNREADAAARFTLPAPLQFANLAAHTGHLRPAAADADDGSALFAWWQRQVDASLTWDALRWLRGVSALPVLVKGVMTGEDARRAVDAGAAGVVVSNHGGRQLDGCAAGVDVLPEVVAAVAGRVPVLVDGGVRRGADVLRALALGASAVLVGRPLLWGLALDGERGAARVMDTLHRELRLAMALAGCARAVDAGRHLVQHEREWSPAPRL